MTSLNEKIAQAITALRVAGPHVEAVSGANNVYRIDGGDALTGAVVLALAIRIGLMDAPDRLR